MNKLYIILLLYFFGCSSIPLKTKTTEVEPVSLDQKTAEDFVKISLKCVDQEYPNSITRTYPAVHSPKQYHATFYGCYDWHSAVHGHWAMLRILNRFPKISTHAEIEKKLANHLQAKKINKELAFLTKNPDFEIPYGAVWFLRLSAELRQAKVAQANTWLQNTKPLEELLLQRLQNYFIKLKRPFREGMHYNTAYALVQFWEYANAIQNHELLLAITSHALRLYERDENCPIAYEPSAGDFLSPCLAEAYLMSKVLQKDKFMAWWQKFLPLQKAVDLETITVPMVPSDTKDYFLGHWIGGAFYKALVLKKLSQILPSDYKDTAIFSTSAKMQYQTGFQLMQQSGYGGEHWLATFAIQALTD